MSPLRLTIDGRTFRDSENRQVTFRGINVAADAKYPTRPDLPSHIPDKFFDGDNVSFVGRPFPLEEAGMHFARLRLWGYNTIRYIFTWEAIEYAGPGKFDEEWVKFTISVLRLAKEYGFYIIMDPHQDVWSRFSGGSGAPMWTVYACGLNPQAFSATEAALVHNTYPDSDNFPKMVWSTNYYRLACQVIFTLFFAGKDFAPKAVIDGKNIQDYLQEHFIAACQHLAKRINEAGDLSNETVIGWENINEPNRGLVGVQDITVVPSEQKLQLGTSPTAWQAILTGSGRACDIETWAFGGMGPYKSGTALVDPQGVIAWLPADYDDSRYGWIRDPGWKLGECLWAQHGVWDPSADILLKKNYFGAVPSTGKKLDYGAFINTYFMDHYRAFSKAIREVHPEAIMFCQPPVLEIPPLLKGTADEDKRMVYAPHYYDGLTLMTKKWNRIWNVDVLGLLRGRYLGPPFAIKLGETAIRNCLRDQLSAIRQEGIDNMGEHPCLLTEFGIPYDMDDKYAYKTGDYSSQLSAMDANHFAVEGSGIDGFTLWAYMSLNNHQWGDFWNGEDLSIFSLDDRPLPNYSNLNNKSTMSLSNSPDNPSLNPLSYNPSPPSYSQRQSSDLSTISRSNLISSTSISAVPSSDTPAHLATPGFRAAEAFVRPSPIVTNGTITKYGFNLRSSVFTLSLMASTPTQEATPTEIFLPDFHFPRVETEVDVSGGKWSISSGDVGGGVEVQKLRWWHGEGEQDIKITGTKRKATMEIGGGDKDGYLDQCKQFDLGKYLFGDTSKETIIEIPQGQLYLVRPQSPKGYSELIFKDAAATIRRTAQEFQYQLVIQRAYEEGEEELLQDEDGEDGAEGGLVSDKDEKIFLLDESLHFRCEVREGGDKVFAWRDLSGDPGDLYEFVCDQSIQASTVHTFELAAIQCQYERKYRRSHENATEQDFQQFQFTGDAIPTASPVSPKAPKATSPTGKTSSVGKGSAAKSALAREQTPTRSKKAASKELVRKEAPTIAPVSAANPEGLEILTRETAELHLFDFASGAFILQDPLVTATVSEVGKWQYWLQITGKERDWLGQPVIADINPVFNFEYLSFIFNHYTTDGSAYSWLLRFKDQETEEKFQEGLMQALWEQLNEIKWAKTKDNEREYVLEAFQDLTMEDAPEGAEGLEEVEEEDVDDGQRSEHYDSDESEEDVNTKNDDGNVNSQLAVGYKYDRSFVVRGSKIGVFKHTPNNNLEFSTNISKVETPHGKLFSPKKVMLHCEDSSMILQNADNPNSLYRMDLEYGKVVDEWKVHDDIPVTSFAPESKFAQMSNEQTFLGLSHNALYRIDPRLAGNKLVESQLKQYASKNGFSAAATTEKGYIAVASNKGDIRMFDRLGINAKTHIPALGEAIIGLDVSADGRWVLATCRTYLLLIDAQQKEGKNAGKLGFERSFGKDSKPQPRRLGLQPSHVAQFQHETGVPISFTPARFNTGLESNETSIITATGPFIVTWNLKKVLAGRKDPYTIKRYAEEVKADNFKFGSDKNVIVALPNEVNMVAKQSFRKPTRESIATPVRVGGGRRSSSRLGGKASGRLGREDIVNSPY